MLKSMERKRLKHPAPFGPRPVHQARLQGRDGVEYDLYRLSVPSHDGAEEETHGPVLLRIRKGGTLVVQGVERRVRAGDTLLLPARGLQAPPSGSARAGLDPLAVGAAILLLLLSLVHLAKLLP